MRFVVVCSFCLAVTGAVAGELPEGFTESAECRKVASWLRQASPPDPALSFTGMIGGPKPTSVGPEVRSRVVREGVEDLLGDPVALDSTADQLTSFAEAVYTVASSASISWARDVHNMPWGMIEGPRDSYHYELVDAVVAAAGRNGVRYVGTFAPFAPWAMSCRPPARPECEHFFDEDFFYLAHEGRMDLPCEPDQIPEILGLLAERYDGDGVADAPGLEAPVHYWQMGNEVEANAICGGYLGDLDAYLAWVEDGAAAIRAACPECRIVLGGALATDRHDAGRQGLQLWRDFVARGGDDHIDVVAIHYNNGKTGNDSIEEFEHMIGTYREIFGEREMWVTEFGVLSGEEDGGFVRLPEPEAAAWYLRYYATGLANGVTRFFSDWIGFVDRDQLQLSYWTNHLCAVKLGGYTEVAKLEPTVIRFGFAQSEVVVAWGDGSLEEVYGDVQVVVTDVYGRARVMPASQVLPRQDPVFVEPAFPRRPRGRVRP